MLLGIFLVVLGGLFLLENMGLLPSGVWGFFWPLVIIVLGLRLIMGANDVCCGWWGGSKIYKKMWGKKSHQEEEKE